MHFAHFLTAAIVLQLAVSSPVFQPRRLTDKETERLAAWSPESKQPMWEISGQYQGDMVLTPSQRNGVIDTRLRWPNREIPYELSNDFTAEEKQFIAQSLATEYAKTCVRPRPRTASDANFVYVTGQNTGCWSYIGRLGGQQQANLQRNGCIWYGTIVHEFLHAAGFYHQQSATERDDWVNIIWQNIEKGQEHNFDKLGTNVISSFGERYDYGSIMHYGETAFSSNGQPTIVPKDPNASIGQNNGLSAIDIAKINKMYNCA